MAVECLSAVLDSRSEKALNLFESLVGGADAILGTRYIERFLRSAMLMDYASVKQTLINMAGSEYPITAIVGGRQLTVAALTIPDAREDGVLELPMGEYARVGAASVYATRLMDPELGAECESRLKAIFWDDSAAVRRAASRCWLDLEPQDIASRGEMIAEFTRSIRPDDDATFLIAQLKKAQGPLPDEVCELAERIFEVYGSKLTSIQTRAAGDAYDLAPLLFRLHDESSSAELQERILNIVDKYVHANVFGFTHDLDSRFGR